MKLKVGKYEKMGASKLNCCHKNLILKPKKIHEEGGVFSNQCYCAWIIFVLHVFIQNLIISSSCNAHIISKSFNGMSLRSIDFGIVLI